MGLKDASGDTIKGTAVNSPSVGANVSAESRRDLIIATAVAEKPGAVVEIERK